MSESESSIQGYADFGAGAAQRVCSQLLAWRPRYVAWVSAHDKRMWAVARGKQREVQLKALRLVATEQIHRAALVRHLRENQIVGRERNVLLGEFYGSRDAACAVLAEHRVYRQAVSSQLCAADLLELSGDRLGLDLLRAYERDFGLYFAMYCDRARARRDGRPYVLASLLPEIKTGAETLRRRILSGDRLPARPAPIAARPLSARAR
jgi:hypothetical protein